MICHVILGYDTSKFFALCFIFDILPSGICHRENNSENIMQKVIRRTSALDILPCVIKNTDNTCISTLDYI